MGIPNQNHITDIINSMLGFNGQDSASSGNSDSTDFSETMKRLQVNMQAVIQFSQAFEKDARSIGRHVNTMLTVIGAAARINRRINRLNVEAIDQDKLGTLSDGMVAVGGVIGLSALITEVLAGMRYTDLITAHAKIGLVSLLTRSLMGMRNYIADIEISSNELPMKEFGDLGLMLMAIIDVIKLIDDGISIKYAATIPLKVKLTKLLSAQVASLVKDLSALADAGADAGTATRDLLVISALVIAYQQIILDIAKVNVGPLFNMKVQRIIKGVSLIQTLVERLIALSKTDGVAEAAVRMAVITSLIEAFSHILVSLMMLGALALLFAAIAMPIVLALLFVGLVIKVIVFIVKSTVNINTLAAIVVLSLVLMGITMLSLMLLVLATVAVQIIKNSKSLLLFFGVLIGVVISIAMLGLVCSAANVLFLPALVGVGMMVIIIGAILLMTAMLAELQTIELDAKLIKENVKMVMDTVFFILTSLFEGIAEPKEGDNWFTRALSTIGGIGLAIIRTLGAIVILVATVVSVLAILLMAGVLADLQEIKLDAKRIKENVHAVLSTCRDIIEQLFAPDSADGQETDKGVLLTIVNWFSPEIGKVLRALVGMAYLFLLTVSIGLVSAIATMLQQLQDLKLDIKKIQTNITAVFDTCDSIINRLFAPDNTEGQKTDKGVLLSFVDWVSPEIGAALRMLMGMAYLFLMTITVCLVLAVATVLRMIQNLGLNTDKIQKNVSAVFDTCDSIINRIFGVRDEEKNPSDRGGFVTFLSWVGQGFANIYNAVLSIAYLTLIIIAVAIVLGIATMLRMIQGLDLRSDVIEEKVSAVFDAVDMIFARVFGPKETRFDFAQNGLLGTIIGFFSPGLKAVISALMSIAQLALIFAAISIVAGIAEQLEVIQRIKIDKDTIIQKVKDIFDTCHAIMEEVYTGSDNLLPEPKDQGIYSSIISFFTPTLGKVLDALIRIEMLSVVFSAVSAISGIGKELDSINKLDIDVPSAAEKVKQILDTAEMLCAEIFARESKINFPVPPEEKQGVFGALIDSLFGGQSDQDRAIQAAMKKVEMLAVISSAVGAINQIQQGIKEINEVQFSQFAAAKAKVKNIIDIAAEISEEIFSSEATFNLPAPSGDQVKQALVEMGADHWYGSSFAERAAARNKAQMIAAMQRIETLSMIAASVGSLVTIIKGLSDIKEYKIPNAGQAQKKVSDIITASSQIAEAIFRLQTGSFGDVLGPKGMNKIKANLAYRKLTITGATEVGNLLKDLINTVDFKEASLDEKRRTLSTGVDMVGQILVAMDTIPLEPGYKERISERSQLLQEISNTIGSFTKVSSDDVRNSKAITENYIRFLQQVDSMDLKKLQHTDWLMRSWAAISRDLKGDFEGLAKSINEHIMPVLDTLNSTMKDVNDCQKHIIDELTKPVSINGADNSSIPSIGGSTTPAGSFDTSAPSGGLGHADGGSINSTPSSSSGNSHTSSSRPKSQPMSQAPGTARATAVDKKGNAWEFRLPDGKYILTKG